MTSTSRLLRFAFPPSRGNRFAMGPEQFERFLAQPLSPGYRSQVHVCSDYAELSREVLNGKSELAWAPPLLCASVEQAGGTVLGRFVRRGLGTYRSVLVAARDGAADTKVLLLQGKRAVWSDPESTSGYLLPVAHLRRLGMVPGETFRSESFAGSVTAALLAVAEGKADLTAVYATPEGAPEARTALDEAPLAVRNRLCIVGYTEEAPNDGLVVAPAVPASTVDYLRWRLCAALKERSACDVLRQVFNADGLAPVKRGDYAVLSRFDTSPR